LPTDGSIGEDGEDAASPNYPDERRLTPSDDSDLYSTLDRPSIQQRRSKENGQGAGVDHLVKPSHLKTRQKIPRGTFSSMVTFAYFKCAVLIFRPISLRTNQTTLSSTENK